MKNRYEVRGEITAIFLNSTKYGEIETIISTKKLNQAKDFPNTWYPKYEPKTDSFYVVGNLTIETNKRRLMSLHRWVLGQPNGFEVDHKNHDTLDNTDENLRIVTPAQNRQNRKGATRKSASGIRGVFWHKSSRKWMVRIKTNGKTKFQGFYENLEEAERIAKQLRIRYMPYS